MLVVWLHGFALPFSTGLALTCSFGSFLGSLGGAAAGKS